MMKNALVTEKGKRSQALFSIILPWIQFFHIYAFITGVTIGYVIIVLIDIYALILSLRSSINFDKRFGWLLATIFFSLITLPISLLLSDNILWISIGNKVIKTLLLYILVAFSVSPRLDWKLYVKSLKILTYIACAAILIEYIMHFLTGAYISIKIPFLKYANAHTDERLSNEITEARFNSIFTEPSHFVYFVFQYLVILLFAEKGVTAKKLISAIAISICVVMAVSSTGIILLALVWTLFIVSFFRMEKNGVRKMALLIAVVAMLIVIGIVLLKNPVFYKAIDRLGGGYSRSNRVWIRIYSNFDKVKELNGLHFLIGNGIGNIESEFMNSFVYLMLNVGLIGTILAVISLLSCFFRSTGAGKIAAIVLILLSGIDMVLFTPTVVGYLVIVNHFSKRKKVNL